jgi:hypothetical protein
MFRRSTLIRAAFPAVLSSVLFAPSAFAQGIITGGIPGCDFGTGELSAKCIPNFIGHLIVFVFQFISVLFLINVMIAGYQLAMGSISGDKGRGKDRLVWSIIGLIVATCSYLILDLVLNVLLGS